MLHIRFRITSELTITLKFNSFKQLLCVCVFYYNSLRVFIHSLSRSLSPFSFFLFPYTLLLRVAAAAAQRSLGDCGCEDDLIITTIHYTRRAFRECVTYGLCVCVCVVCLFVTAPVSSPPFSFDVLPLTAHSNVLAPLGRGALLLPFALKCLLLDDEGWGIGLLLCASF